MPISFPHPRSRRFAAPLAAVLLLAACDDDPARVETPQSVTLRSEAPTGAYVDSSSTLPLSVSATSASGGELTGRTFTWASSSPAVATVADGVVTGVAPGTATISATTGGVTGSLQITVERRAGDLAIWPTTITLGLGSSYPVEARVMKVPGDCCAIPHSVHYTTSAAGVVAVSPAGVMQGTGLGTATVTARAGALAREIQVTVEPAYTLVVLGTLGGDESLATAVNDASEVVGQAQKADGRWYPFLWRNGTMTALPTPDDPIQGGSSSGAATDINDAGTVVGQVAWHAVVWRDGVMTDLHPAEGTFGGDAFRSIATGINSRGDVVGYTSSDLEKYVDGAVFVVTEGGTYWRTYPDPWHHYTASAINDDRVIVGTEYDGGTPSSPALSMTYAMAIRPMSAPVVLKPGVGGFGNGHDINAAGQMVGVAQATSIQPRRPFLWSPSGKGTDLGTLGYYGHGYAYGLNDRGDVVGEEGRLGFVVRSGKMLNLTAMAGNGTWWVEQGVRINNRGQIAAVARNLKTGKRSAVLLNPPGR